MLLLVVYVNYSVANICTTYRRMRLKTIPPILKPTKLEINLMPYSTPNTYGDWYYTYDPPPIPDRRHDWQAWHKDYDGPEDPRPVLTAATESDILKEIKEWNEDNKQT